MMYFPYAQSEYSAYWTPRSMSLVVRANGDPSLITAAVRRVVHELDATTPISRVTTLDALVARDAAGFFAHVTEDLDERRVCGTGPLYTLLRALEGEGPLDQYEIETLNDSLFELTEGGWRMVVHHATPAPEAVPSPAEEDDDGPSHTLH